MVTLHTIDGGTVNAINDALLYDFIIGQNGIATGATVTSEGALLLHIDSGWGVINGRIFSIEAETVSATPSTSGTVKGRLILQIDITNTTNPITFVTQAAATLPALQQEDINNNGTIYQLPIATYDVNEVAVSNLQMVAPSVEAIKERIDSAVRKANAAIPKSLTHNPITSTSDDTIANWKNLGIGVAWYDTANCLIDQPAQWGYLINICMDTNNDVRQFFCAQPSADVYWRAGNEDGWQGSWHRMPSVDANNMFTGVLVAKPVNYTGDAIRNILPCDSSWKVVSTDKIVTLRK